MMKSLQSNVAAIARDIAGIAGAGLIIYGAWLIYPPAGFLSAGLMLLAAAWLTARTK
jgi:hypothetical protein